MPNPTIVVTALPDGRINVQTQHLPDQRMGVLLLDLAHTMLKAKLLAPAPAAAGPPVEVASPGQQKVLLHGG